MIFTTVKVDEDKMEEDIIDEETKVGEQNQYEDLGEVAAVVEEQEVVHE